MPQALPDRYPDYHFLFIARNVPVAWFFDAARPYWERYRPTVLANFDLLAFVPAGRTVIVTALVMRDTGAIIGVDLARNRPDAYYDPIIQEAIEGVQTVFAQRVGLNQPFGVPLADATAPPTDASIPTPMLPTQPRTFITATPAPAQTATPAPRPAPLQPTPGVVISTGGG